MFPDYYLKNCNKWWDGYRQECNVLIDDFDKVHSVLGHHLKIWGDRYGFVGEVKSSQVAARPKCLVITSNYHPREIWSDAETLAPILRRYRVIKFSCENGLYTQVDEGRLLRHERLDVPEWDCNHRFHHIPDPVLESFDNSLFLDLDSSIVSSSSKRCRTT